MEIDLPKLELNKAICFETFETIIAHATRTFYEAVVFHHLHHPTIEVYLSNKTLLI
ncbi:MAG: hypothetical protein V1799_06370 [bacterium]